MHRFGPLARYLALTAALSVALLSAFTFIIYRQSLVLENNSQLVQHHYEALRQSRQVLTSMLDMETGLRGYLLTGDESFLIPYKNGLEAIEEDVLNLQKQVVDDLDQRMLTERINRQTIRIKRLMDQQIKTFSQRGMRRLTKGDLDVAKAEMNEMRVQIEDFIAGKTKALEQSQQDARQAQKRYLLILILGMVVAMAGLLLANLTIIRLISRTRESERKLEASEERFRLFIEGSSDGVYDYDTQKNHVYFSPGHEALLGYSEREMGNNPESFNRLLHADDIEPTWQAFHLYESKQAPRYQTTFRMRHKNGSWRWILSRGVGIWNEEGKLTRLVGMHSDVTELKEREEQLSQLNADLESFTYIASHDLRSPLVNLRGFAGEIRYNLEQMEPLILTAMKTLDVPSQEKLIAAFDQEIPEALEFINSSVEKMDKLTTAILDLSRIGKRELRMEEVDTQALVERCIAALSFEISRLNITVEFKELPKVTCDVMALEQIFSNILENAVKYTSPERPGHIKVSAKRLADKTQFMIEDNGRGIAHEDTQKVFDIFRRASNSGDVRGAGMGMAYVKATLRRLGGRIWFESKLNQGTCFCFTLPHKPLFNRESLIAESKGI